MRSSLKTSRCDMLSLYPTARIMITLLNDPFPLRITQLSHTSHHFAHFQSKQTGTRHLILHAVGTKQADKIIFVRNIRIPRATNMHQIHSGRLIQEKRYASGRNGRFLSLETTVNALVTRCDVTLKDINRISANVQAGSSIVSLSIFYNVIVIYNIIV